MTKRIDNLYKQTVNKIIPKFESKLSEYRYFELYKQFDSCVISICDYWDNELGSFKFKTVRECKVKLREYI